MNWRRILAIIIIVGLLLILDYLRFTYVLDFFNPFGDVLLSRLDSDFGSMEIVSLIQGEDPRLYSMLFYAFFSLLFTVLLLNIVFELDKWWQFTIYIYVGVYFITFILIGVLVVLSMGDQAYYVFSKVKNVLSSSFVSIFLIPFYKYFDKNGQNKNVN